MANLTSSLIVRLVNQVSRPAATIRNSLLGIQRTAQGANRVSFGDRLSAGMRRNEAALANARGGLFDAAAGFYALKTAIGAPVRAAMEFESVMADVAKVVDFPTSDAFDQFKADLIDLSKQVPFSIQQLGELAAAAGESFDADDILKVVTAASQVGVAFGISAAEAGEALPQMMNAMNLTLDEAILLSDGINHLSNNMASSAPKVLNFMQSVGADAIGFGFAAEQAAALGSTMIASGFDANVAATSFRNMGRALTRGGSATTRQRAAYAALGLDARQVAEDMQDDAEGTLLKVIEAFDQIPVAQRAALQSDLFGNEARALTPLINNVDKMREALGLVAEEGNYAGSSFKEFEVRAGTFENAMQIFNNRMSELKIVIGAALIPAINNLMDAISPVIDRISEFVSLHPDLVSNVAAAAAAIIGFKVAVAGLKFIGLLGRGGALSLLSLGLNTVGRASARLWAAAAANVAYSASLKGMSGAGALTRLQRVGAAVRGMAFAVPGVAMLSTVFGWLAGAAAAVGAAIAGITAPVWGLIAVAVAAVAAAGYSLWKWWDRISAVFSGVAKRLGEELQPAFDAIKPVLDAIAPVTDAVGAAFGRMKDAIGVVIDWFQSKWTDFKTWIGGFFQREVLTDADKAAFEQSGYDMADGMINSVKEVIGNLVEWFRDLPGRIIAAVGNINLGELISWPEPPDWWKALMGDDEPVAPPVTQGTGFNQLPQEQQRAAGIVQSAQGSTLPTTGELSALQSHAQGLREEIGRIQFDMDALIDSPMKPALIAPMQGEMRNLQDELQGVETELAEGKVLADELTWALGVLSETDTAPEISTTSIDDALAKVQRLSSELARINNGVATVGSQVPIDGRRAGGGDVRSGGTYMVGEEGPELVTFGQRGFVHTARQTMRMMSGAAKRIGGGGQPMGLSGLSGLMDQGAAALSATSARSAPASPSGSRGLKLEINSPLTGPITITSGQNPLDVVEQLGDALETMLAQKMRGLYSDGVA
jgi:TP901 family phage tail tape measure protein